LPEDPHEGISVRRFFVEKIPKAEGSVTITGKEAKHISRALRMGIGDQFILLDREGVRFEVIVESVTPGSVTVALERQLPPPPESPVDLSIGQALLKSSAMEMMIQKTTELGVTAVYPFIARRSVVRPRAEKWDTRGKRWQDIAVAASKQSDRARPPDVMPVQSFEELLQNPARAQTLKLILWEEEQERGLKSTLRSLLPGSKGVLALVGPEGGFAREEILRAGEAGFIPVSLGPQTLRAETAAIAVTAIMHYESQAMEERNNPYA